MIAENRNWNILVENLSRDSVFLFPTSGAPSITLVGGRLLLQKPKTINTMYIKTIKILVALCCVARKRNNYLSTDMQSLTGQVEREPVSFYRYAIPNGTEGCWSCRSTDMNTAGATIPKPSNAIKAWVWKRILVSSVGSCKAVYRTFPIVNAVRSQFNWFQYRLLFQIAAR